MIAMRAPMPKMNEALPGSNHSQDLNPQIYIFDYGIQCFQSLLP